MSEHMFEVPESRLEELMQAEADYADLRKARGCDEIIMEQLKYKKEKAEAERDVDREQYEATLALKDAMIAGIKKERDELKAEKEILLKRIEVLGKSNVELEAERDELESWKAKYENENMVLKKEIKVLKEQNDWYATKYDEHKCLENFLDDVFDSAYECNIDRPWRNLFEDYCERNGGK